MYVCEVFLDIVDCRNTISMAQISVIDLFAGPGGLAEGFSSFTRKTGDLCFQVNLSVEKDLIAHKTLLLRAFYRQFRRVPAAYKEYLINSRRTDLNREELFARHPAEFETASREALHAELGNPRDEEAILTRVDNVISETNEPLVLIGGPPCQAYSLAGRSRMAGLRRTDLSSYEKDERHTLYREYLKILAYVRPAAFVMENVKGILSSKLQGKEIFSRIIDDLSSPAAAFSQRIGNSVPTGYRIVPLVKNDRLDGCYLPEDYIVRAEQHGIPQSRHRVLIIGIRDDIANDIGYLTPMAHSGPTLRSVIGDLPPIRSTLSKRSDSLDSWRIVLDAVLHAPWFGIDTKSLDKKIWNLMKEQIASINRFNLTPGGEFVVIKGESPSSKLTGFPNHAARGHMDADLHRYFFASCFASAYGRSPTLRDFPRALLPDHQNIGESVGQETIFLDRFRVQLAERPATTITSHIAKDGHYFIHYDPAQCRSLTVREAARAQTFPDDYLFEGPRTAQYSQVGNAVPPKLARQIAEAISHLWPRNQVR